MVNRFKGSNVPTRLKDCLFNPELGTTDLLVKSFAEKRMAPPSKALFKARVFDQVLPLR
ncbi:hypothetical protein D3C87_1670650 [compost metagenome]